LPPAASNEQTGAPPARLGWGAQRWVAAGIAGVFGLAIGIALGVRFSRLPLPERPVAAAQTIPVSFGALTGWAGDDFGAVLPALKASCAAFQARGAHETAGEGALARPVAQWHHACDRLAPVLTGNAPGPAVRAVLEQSFTPMAVMAPQGPTPDRGTFTGYYEAELNGSLTQDSRFCVPIYGVPRDLVAADLSQFLSDLPAGMPRQIVGRVVPTASGQKLAPYFTREQIDGAGVVADRADVLIWADDPVAVHILHIQGSGRVTLPDGRHLRLRFAGHNGHRFKGIGAILREAGALPPDGATMDAVRAWLRAHPADAARYMNRNARYIFFQLAPDDTAGPVGALGVPLTAGRSLAIDPRVVPLGAPVWLDTQEPDGRPLQRLMVAQDTGAAITGAVRGDVYWGSGEAAFAIAARMKSTGRYYVLVPRDPD
jgi:membrane-bound lytic murein transglycosylase A